MDSIKETERCTCEPKIERDGKQYPPKAASAGLGGLGKAVGGLWNWATGAQAEKESARKGEL